MDASGWYSWNRLFVFGVVTLEVWMYIKDGFEVIVIDRVGVFVERCGMASGPIRSGIAGELPVFLRRFLEFEQCNMWKPERFRDPARESELERGYLPEAGGAFRLPCVRVRRNQLYVYGRSEEVCTGLDLLDANWRGSDDWTLFPIHPSQCGHYGELVSRMPTQDMEIRGQRLWATPTSSTRTLLVWPDGQPEKAFFTKLSLYSKFLGDRRLTRRKVAASVGLSHLVLTCGADLPIGIDCLPEPFGLTLRGVPDGGVIMRGLPDEIRQGRVIIAPLFALMGGSGDHPPLLLRLVEKTGGDILELLNDVLLAKFAALWVDLVFDFGLILEAHGQDLLLALSSECVPLGGFYYRDFEGLTVDWALRHARGCPEPESLPHACEWFSTYETWGYPLFQLVSTKMITSLWDYMNLVLGELEEAILGWQIGGVMPSGRIKKGELTVLFSRYLRRAIQEKFGMSESEDYDIRHQLRRFAKFLLQVRKEVMWVSAAKN